MSALSELGRYGQSFWLDQLSREMLRTGELARRVEADGLRGVTSNPKIFADAINASQAYDDDIVRLAREGLAAAAIAERLMVDDVKDACDVLRPVYDGSDSLDGYVSLEVSPHLARDAAASLQEARRLFAAVNRPNVSIKIPGTPQSVPAIEDALTEGININITLLFSTPSYHAVAEAFDRALECRLVRGLGVDRPTSVASFFLSRIDIEVDRRLDEIGGPGRSEAQALKGQAAVATAKVAYQMFRSMVDSPHWRKRAQLGARVQRVLWASTGTKNPDDRDVKYIEPLIGPQTISTMPDKTARAFADHGTVAATVEEGVGGALETLQRLAAIGIDLHDVSTRLLEEGIEKFRKPYDALVSLIEERRRAATATIGARG